MNRAVEREHALMEMLKTRTPMVETYLQNLKFLPQGGSVPVRRPLLPRPNGSGRHHRSHRLSQRKEYAGPSLGRLPEALQDSVPPPGLLLDDLCRPRPTSTASITTSALRTANFWATCAAWSSTVTPKKDSGKGRFVGRIWVEDQDYNIVRLNGTYEPRPRNAYFFHMDSWRLNLVPGYWVPAYIYSEEGSGTKDDIAFKAQTRLWGYDLQKSAGEGEFTEVQVDSTRQGRKPRRAGSFSAASAVAMAAAGRRQRGRAAAECRPARSPR